MAFDVVLFDLDGTLTDSQAGIAASYHHALGTLGLRSTDAEIKALIGPPLQDNLISLGVPADKLEDAIVAYREYYAQKGMFDNELFDGVAEVLASLHAAGTTIALATSKLVDYATEILEHFEMSHFFTAVAGSSRDGTRSHKDEVVEDALESLGLPERESVALVGDRQNDMWAARDLGLYGVGALWGYGSKVELLNAGAQVLAARPEELLALLLA